MALNPCVKAILCSLSSGLLIGLQSLIDGQIALIQIQITQYQTQLLQYDVLSIPIEASAALSQAFIDSVRSGAAVIPLSTIANAGCSDLGDFNVNLNQVLDVITSASDDVVFEATRLLSYKEELNDIITALNNTTDQFTEINLLIDACLAGQ